jgi:5-methylcytosine-specific restriction endonuclease McrA
MSAMRSPCRKCGSTRGRIEERDPHHTLVCDDCGAYVRHVSRKELGLKTRSVRSRPGIKPSIRARVLERWGYKCGKCGRSPLVDGVVLHVDHYKPVSTATSEAERADLEREDNLWTLCAECNLGKSNNIEAMPSMPSPKYAQQSSEDDAA